MRRETNGGEAGNAAGAAVSSAPAAARADETLLEQTGGFSQTYDLEPADEEYEDGEYDEYDETLGTGGFLGSLLLMSIPVVGLLIGLIWAFGGSRRVSSRSWRRRTCSSF